jgi:RNA polymerase sigma-70 factor (ECF subfamily)
MSVLTAIQSVGWGGLDSASGQEDVLDIQACLNGNQDAYARLVERYERLVTSQMWRFTRDHAILEELVQEVFVEAYTSLPGYKGKAPFLHWLRRIATRVGYRFWKNKTRAQERQEQFNQNPAEVLPDYSTATPSEAGEYVHQLLHKIPAGERMVLTLMYFDGWSTQEIADHMGWTRSLVKVRAFRARKKLKTMLEEAGYGQAISI